MKTTETKELFAIVPQDLTAHPDIDPVDKLIFTHLLGKCRTKKDDGQPWTFSVPGIAKGTGLNERTVRRHVKIIREHGVLKLYGSLMNGKKSYDVFVFVPKALDSLISTTDKMSAVIPNVDNGFDEHGKQQRTTTTDNEFAQMSDRKKIVEVRFKKEDSKKEDDPNNNGNAFEDLEQAFQSQSPNPLMKEIKTEKLKPAKRSVTLDEWFGFNPDA